MCGKNVKDGDKCLSHSKNKKSNTRDVGLLEALSLALQGIFEETLSDNTSKKAILALMSDKAQASLLEILVKKESKESKKKDPAAPKKNVNSFIMYCRDNRKKSKDAHPNLKGTEITKKLAIDWNDISDEDKEKYITYAIEDKERYITAMKVYDPTYSDKSKKSGPKKGKNAYLFFCADKRPELKEEHEDMDSKDITRELGRLWKDMSKKEKAPYQQRSDDDKKRYEEEKSAEEEEEEEVEEKEEEEEEEEEEVEEK